MKTRFVDTGSLFPTLKSYGTHYAGDKFDLLRIRKNADPQNYFYQSYSLEIWFTHKNDANPLFEKMKALADSSQENLQLKRSADAGRKDYLFYEVKVKDEKSQYILKEKIFQVLQRIREMGLKPETYLDVIDHFEVEQLQEQKVMSVAVATDLDKKQSTIEPNKHAFFKLPAPSKEAGSVEQFSKMPQPR